MNDIRRVNRMFRSAEEEVRIVLGGPRGECSIAGCASGRTAEFSIQLDLEFQEAGKRLANEIEHSAIMREIKKLRREARDMNVPVAHPASLWRIKPDL